MKDLHSPSSDIIFFWYAFSLVLNNTLNPKITAPPPIKINVNSTSVVKSAIRHPANCATSPAVTGTIATVSAAISRLSAIILFTSSPLWYEDIFAICPLSVLSNALRDKSLAMLTLYFSVRYELSVRIAIRKISTATRTHASVIIICFLPSVAPLTRNCVIYANATDDNAASTDVTVKIAIAPRYGFIMFLSQRLLSAVSFLFLFIVYPIICPLYILRYV